MWRSDAIVRACTDPQHETPVGWKAHASMPRTIYPGSHRARSADIADREVHKAVATANNTGAIYRPMTDTARI
jgi:hypothetical protein